MEELYKQLGARIRSRRRTLRVLQGDLAEKAGLSRGSISNIEAGRQQLYVHHLVAIAKALRQDPADLLPSPPADDAARELYLQAARAGTAASSEED